MKVLVAIDGWNEGHAAIDALVRQQLPQGSEVRVISVVDGRLERFLLGSVSQAVAARAGCSVAIVRSPQARANEG